MKAVEKNTELNRMKNRNASEIIRRIKTDICHVEKISDGKGKRFSFISC
jgi:hypothetical protein